MDIIIEKGRMEHSLDCVEALQNSDLGRIYFAQKNKALQAIHEGMDHDEIVVAINDVGIVTGFLWFIPKGAFHSFPYLHIIAVKEEYRNLGLGKKLLDYFEKEIVKSSKAFLVVADFNPKAKALYEKLGYKEVGVLPNLYKVGVTEYLMMKEF